jgi:hypothetical protein
MSNLFRNLASRGGLSFAHLAGLNAKASKAEDDKPEDEDKKEDAKAEGDEPKEDDDKKDAKRADDGDDEDKKEKAEDDEDDAKAEDEDDKKEAKADDGDDDDEEMRGKSAVAKARLREQARCASIFASKAAARNPVLAANLAFNTRMSRKEALAVLESTPAAASNHAERSARNPNIGSHSGAKPSPQQALAARWDANLKAANPSRR